MKTAFLLPVFLLVGVNLPCVPTARAQLEAYDINRSDPSKKDQPEGDSALAHYDQVMVEKHKEAVVYNSRGLEKDKTQDVEGAIVDFDKAIQLSPGDAIVYNNRGNAKGRKRDYDGSIVDFDRAIQLDPTCSEAYCNRGISKERKQDYEGAIADFDQAIHLNLRLPALFDSRASLRNANGDLAGALADYNQAILLSGDDSTARFFRHLILRQLGRAGEDDLSTEVAQWKEGWSKAIGLFLCGNISEAEFRQRATLRTELDKKVQSCQLNYYIGMAYLIEGRLIEAKNEFRDCQASGLSDRLEFTLANAQLLTMAKQPALVSLPNIKAAPQVTVVSYK